jgi:hypothetical protein
VTWKSPYNNFASEKNELFSRKYQKVISLEHTEAVIKSIMLVSRLGLQSCLFVSLAKMQVGSPIPYANGD